MKSRISIAALALLAFGATAHAAPPAAKSAPKPAPAPKPLPPPPSAPPVATTSAAVEKEQPSTSSGETDPRIAVAPIVGFGTDDMNLGFGLRGTKMLTDRLSVGGTFVYHLGKSVDAPAIGGVSASASMHLFYVGPEVGYDFAFAPVVVRAYTGVGLAAISASSSVAGVSVSNTDTKFVFWPGATVLDLPDSPYFVGADARLVFIPGGPALGAYALAGTRF